MYLQEKFPSDFILHKNNITIKQAKIDDLMYIWSASKEELKGLVTCRPIAARGYDSTKKLFLRKMENPNICFFVISLFDSPIGKISFSDYNSRNRSVEIGYSLLPAFRNHGYMTSALKLLISYVFENTDINKVYAQTASFNDSSIKLLENLGFFRDACLREHHEQNGLLYSDFIYSILASDYRRNGLPDLINKHK